MAWPCSRTQGICVGILLLGLAINPPECLSPPQTRLLSVSAGSRARLNGSLRTLSCLEPFQSWQASMSLGEDGLTMCVKCAMCCLKMLKNPIGCGVTFRHVGGIRYNHLSFSLEGMAWRAPTPWTPKCPQTAHTF